MSFRRAVDHTYIAQLLGRMVRTPTQQHINVDETLNDVHLYLPQFNEATVYDVVKALQDEEGATIPTDIEAEEMGRGNYDTLSLRPTYQTQPRQPGRERNENPDQLSMFDTLSNGDISSVQPSSREVLAELVQSEPQRSISSEVSTQPAAQANPAQATPAAQPVAAELTPPTPVAQQPIIPNIDREAVVKAINDAGLLTYDVRRVRITDYMKSMYALAGFLTRVCIDLDAKETIISDIVKMIHDHIALLKQQGMYDVLAGQVLQFKLSAQIFDVFGRSIDDYATHDV